MARYHVRFQFLWDNITREGDLNEIEYQAFVGTCSWLGRPLCFSEVLWWVDDSGQIHYEPPQDRELNISAVAQKTGDNYTQVQSHLRFLMG